MSLHLVKLCVGCDAIPELSDWQRQRLKDMKAAGETPEIVHRTFQSPKRRSELLAGGSLYWVIKGVIAARQCLVDIREGQRPDGTPCAVLVLDRRIVPVRPVPRRPFQGWRYLTGDDAPRDLGKGEAEGLADMPPRMRRELADLGLI